MQEANQEAMLKIVLEKAKKAHLEVVNVKKRIFIVNIFFIYVIIFLGDIDEKENI